jgi:hypothetical protein
MLSNEERTRARLRTHPTNFRTATAPHSTKVRDAERSPYLGITLPLRAMTNGYNNRYLALRTVSRVIHPAWSRDRQQRLT